MFDKTEARLRGIFDYQKFEREPHLQSIIDGTRRGSRALDDDELVFAAGGNQEGSPKPGYKYCTNCGGYRKFRSWSGGREACCECNKPYKPQPGEAKKGAGI